MKIMIIGDGKIGSVLAEQLSKEKHEVTLVDHSVVTKAEQAVAEHGVAALVDDPLGEVPVAADVPRERRPALRRPEPPPGAVVQRYGRLRDDA